MPNQERVSRLAPSLLAVLIAFTVASPSPTTAATTRTARSGSRQRAKPRPIKPATRGAKPAAKSKLKAAARKKSKVPRTKAVLAEIERAALRWPSLSYPKLATKMNERSAFRKKYPGFSGQNITDTLTKFGAAKRLTALREEAHVALLEAQLEKMSSKLGTEAKQRKLGISQTLLDRLRKQYPEQIGIHFQSRRVQIPWSEAKQKRAQKLSLDHPSVKLEELGPIFQADSVLGKVTTWDKDSVYWVRKQGMPKRQVRIKAMASAASAILEAQPLGKGLDAAMKKVVADHPGAHLDRLKLLARKEPALDRALRRFPDSPRALVERRGKSRTQLSREAKAAASTLKRMTLKMFKEDVLIERIDIQRAWNADKELVAKYGKMTKDRFYSYRDQGYPDFRDDAYKNRIIGREIAAIKKKHPGIEPKEITTKLKKKHPRWKHGRLAQLRKSGDYEKTRRAGTSTQQQAKDAARLAAYQKRHPKETLAQIADKWRPEHSRFNKSYLGRLRVKHKELFGTTNKWNALRASRPMRKTFQLVQELAEPGTTPAQLIAAYNKILEERGFDRLPAGRRGYQQLKKFGVKGIREQHAQRTSEIVAEFAAAAEKGTSQAEIEKAVRAKFDKITTAEFKYYRTLWTKYPKRFPALDRFRNGRTLQIVGLGRKRVPVVHRKGWNPQKALLEHPKHAGRLARLTQYAQVPMSLPLLEEMVAALGGRKPLATQNVFMVGHLLGSSYALVNALRKAGAAPKSTVMVSTPYGITPAVEKSLREDGHGVRVPGLDVEKYRREVQKGLDDAIALHRRNHQRIVVLDDGGLVSEILHSNKKYKPYLKHIVIVEQTTQGIRLAEKRTLGLTIISAARSLTKKFERTFIGRAVTGKLMQGLSRLPPDQRKDHVAVIGGGWIGLASAKALDKQRTKDLGAKRSKVMIVETNKRRAAAARRAGFRVVSMDVAMRSADIVVGATGGQHDANGVVRPTITLKDLRKMKSGAVVVSASSKQVEIDMKGLRKASRRRTLLKAKNPLVRLPTASYVLGRKRITVLGDGWPINFDGDVEDIPSNDIQLTRALMFAAALEAASTGHKLSSGIVKLDGSVDKRLLARFKALRRGKRTEPIGDPDRWQDVALSYASLLGDVK